MRKRTVDEIINDPKSEWLINKVLPELSPTEEQVLALTGQGYTNRQIGEILSIDQGDVATYHYLILNKMGVKRMTKVGKVGAAIDKLTDAEFKYLWISLTEAQQQVAASCIITEESRLPESKTIAQELRFTNQEISNRLNPIIRTLTRPHFGIKGRINIIEATDQEIHHLTWRLKPINKEIIKLCRVTDKDGFYLKNDQIDQQLGLKHKTAVTIQSSSNRLEKQRARTKKIN